MSEKQYTKTLADFRFCKYCRFWKHDWGFKGQCRANAPTIDEDNEGIWPDTIEDDWCGRIELGVNKCIEDNPPTVEVSPESIKAIIDAKNPPPPGGEKEK
jgi:hypothetical protein